MPDKITLALCLLIAYGSSVATAEESFSDPTRPPVVVQSELELGLELDGPSDGSLNLTAIMVTPDRHVAVINGQRVCEGDEIAGAHVVSIGPWGVTLDEDGTPVELRLSRKTVTSATPPSEEQ